MFKIVVVAFGVLAGILPGVSAAAAWDEPVHVFDAQGRRMGRLAALPRTVSCALGRVPGLSGLVCIRLTSAEPGLLVLNTEVGYSATAVYESSDCTGMPFRPVGIGQDVAPGGVVPTSQANYVNGPALLVLDLAGRRAVNALSEIAFDYASGTMKCAPYVQTTQAYPVAQTIDLLPLFTPPFTIR